MQLRGHFGHALLVALILTVTLSACTTRRSVSTMPAPAVPAPPKQRPGAPEAEGTLLDSTAIAAALAQIQAPPRLDADLLAGTETAVFEWFLQLERWSLQAMVPGGRQAGTGWIVDASGRALLLEAMEAYYTAEAALNQFDHHYMPVTFEDGSQIYVPRETEPLGALTFIETNLEVRVRPQAVVISGEIGDTNEPSMFSYIDQAFLLDPGPDGEYRIASISYNNR